MIFDNKVNIDCDNKVSQVISVKNDEPAILIKLLRKTGQEDDVIKLRRTIGKSVRTDVINIPYDFIKIRVAPFESFFIEGEFKKRQGSYTFQIVRGSNLELLFYELEDKYHNIQSHSELRKFTYIIGSPGYSYLAVKEESQAYFIDISINTKEFSYRDLFQIANTKPIVKQLKSLNESLKVVQEMFPDDDRVKLMRKQDFNFEAIVSKHFNPKLG